MFEEHFSPLPLLIVDEIGGVPAGRGGLSLQNITCYFPTPLFVAIAPLSLPYILRRKTQGRRVNTFNNRNRVVYLPLAVLRSITGHSGGGRWKSFDNIALLLF